MRPKLMCVRRLRIHTSHHRIVVEASWCGDILFSSIREREVCQRGERWMIVLLTLYLIWLISSFLQKKKEDKHHWYLIRWFKHSHLRLMDAAVVEDKVDTGKLFARLFGLEEELYHPLVTCMASKCKYIRNYLHCCLSRFCLYLTFLGKQLHNRIRTTKIG